MSDSDNPRVVPEATIPGTDRDGSEHRSDEEPTWVELDWSGQRLYLPEYTARFREIEETILSAIEGLGFRECLFPKLVTEAQFEELQGALPRFDEEGTSEAVHATCVDIDGFPREFVHTHWQCEPFYYYLEEETPDESVLFYDRSGWSHRREKSISDDRLFEFQRIESVWFAPEAEAKALQHRLLDALTEAISELGLPTTVIRKEDEERATGEPAVYDIEVPTEEYGPVEVTGAHYHGPLFLDAVDADVSEGYMTGCCGIGTSRLTNLVLEQEKRGSL